MKKTLLFSLLIGLVSCSSAEKHPDYDANLALVKAAFEAHENENIEDWLACFSVNLVHESALYGVGRIGLDAQRKQMERYHQEFDSIKFTKAIWLQGVKFKTNVPDGSVRCYGTWTGIHTSTGKEIAMSAYHYFDFKNGRIDESGDFFDFGGMMNAVLAGTGQNHPLEAIENE